MAASSTPIHISNRASIAAGSDSPTLTTRSLGQQSSSVPTSAAAAAAGGIGISNLQQQQQLATNSSNTSMAASNQSLGVAQTAQSGIGTATTSITPPNSAGLRSSTAFDFKLKRRPSLKVLLHKLPSSDSLSNSPAPSSPGIVNWASDSKYDGNQTDKASADTTKLNRKESYKAQRKNYRREKKRVASELMNSLQDPAVIVLADWLKVRGTLKSWTKLWCVLKPGLLLIYKSPKTKSSHWVGTVLLTSCQVIERPSKKDGFCFKLFHPMEQSIWAPRGPDKETIGAVVQPLPTAYLIFRAPSQAAGKCWMDALELSLRCSALLLRSNNNAASALQTSSFPNDTGIQISHETQWSEADYEKHFNEQVGNTSAATNNKNSSKFLAVPQFEFVKTSASELSLPSRSATPIFQNVYTTMINWERKMLNTPEFNKLKNLKHFGKSKRSSSTVEALSSACDYSDGSSPDCSPKPKHEAKSKTTLSLQMRKHRMEKFKKSISLGSVLGGPHDGVDDELTSTSDDDDFESTKLSKRVGRSSSPRPVSAPLLMADTRNTHSKDLDGDSQNERAGLSGNDSDSDSEAHCAPEEAVEEEIKETPYVPVQEEEIVTQAGETVEELAEEHKGLIWHLLKQVRPGMDLSKVVLPTFILEPRSFLDKLSDSYYHADLLSRAVHEDDPFTRMKTVVQWYLSGFYKKPKGLKKPYNPILGETFRCYWEHPNNSRTYYIAEQVSHHPPISAFYVTNRQDGFSISCSILAKSKFYGNSTSAVLEGVATLTLLPRGESYTLTTPYAHCKGILMGTLSMELGGKIQIECENTGYKTDLEFKLKPLFGNADSTNAIAGKIKLGKEVLATIHGHWDTQMLIKDTRTGEESVLFEANKETKKKRLLRYCVPIDCQLPNESERLWHLVSQAIRNDDQTGATEEKTVLEEAQRNDAKERKANLAEWEPLLFKQDLISGQWLYKFADLRPWDPRNDLKQFEYNYQVLTKTKLQAPIKPASILLNDSRQKLLYTKGIEPISNDDSDETSHSAEDDDPQLSRKSMKKIIKEINQLRKLLDEQSRQLENISSKLETMRYTSAIQQRHHQHHGDDTTLYALATKYIPESVSQSTVIKTVILAFIGIFLCLTIKWLTK